MNEVWLPIEDYEGLYEISNLGRVKVLSKYRGLNYSTFTPERIKKPSDNGRGYKITSLCKNSCKRTFYIHRLVALYFIPNPLRLKEVNHIDGNKENCQADNLEWCSRMQNESHAWATGLKKQVGVNHFASKPVMQLDLQGNEIKRWDNASLVQKALGFASGHISKCCNGQLNTAYGHKWRFI